MIVNVGNHQIVGTREEQQDNFGVSDFLPGEEIPSTGVFGIVADGMGGLNGGAQASKIAVSESLKVFDKLKNKQNGNRLLVSSFKFVDEQVKKYAKEINSEGNCGTTGAAVLITQKGLHWISVGDSRIYLLRNKILTCLTQDHNHELGLWNEVRAGKLSRDEAQTDSEASHLTSFLGGGLKLADRSLRPMPLEDRDRLLLCSDGLFGTLTGDRIRDLVAMDPFTQAAENLLQAVSEKGGEHQDNATVVLFQIQDTAAEDDLISQLKSQFKTPQPQHKESLTRGTFQEVKPLSDTAETSSGEKQTPSILRSKRKRLRSFAIWLIAFICIIFLLLSIPFVMWIKDDIFSNSKSFSPVSDNLSDNLSEILSENKSDPLVQDNSSNQGIESATHSYKENEEEEVKKESGEKQE